MTQNVHKQCVCESMTKQEQIREIIVQLLAQNRDIGYYSKPDIERAIMTCRGCDLRTINNWFNYLWKLEYFIQPQLGIYHLNLNMIQTLELKPPIQIDPKQRKLL